MLDNLLGTGTSIIIHYLSLQCNSIRTSEMIGDLVNLSDGSCDRFASFLSMSLSLLKPHWLDSYVINQMYSCSK